MNILEILTQPTIDLLGAIVILAMLIAVVVIIFVKQSKSWGEKK